MIQLVKSKVKFEEEPHRYTLAGVELEGVTSGLLKWLFPSTYDGIDDEVLAKAAERGHNIHREIEVADSCGLESSDIPEVNDYIRLRDENDLESIANEYLITDGERIASAIDVVFERDGEVILCDVKCTASLHHENVTAQLSIYRYLFYLQNNGLLPSDTAYVCWLPKPSYGYKSRMAEIKLIDVERIREMVHAYLQGDDADEYRKWFDNSETQLPALYANMLDAMAVYEQQVKAINEEKKHLQEQLLVYFRAHGIKSFKNDRMSITYVDEGERISVDSTKLKTEYPDIFEECKKVSKVKDSIRIKIKE